MFDEEDDLSPLTEDEDSAIRYASCGSSVGKFAGSGFSSEGCFRHLCWSWIEHNLPESSPFSIQRDSHCNRSMGIPQSASITIGKGVELARSFVKLMFEYLKGFVGMLSSFGGQGGAGNGFEYRTRTRRSSLLCYIVRPNYSRCFAAHLFLFILVAVWVLNTER
jgi:hypothetical protein